MLVIFVLVVIVSACLIPVAMRWLREQGGLDAPKPAKPPLRRSHRGEDIPRPGRKDKFVYAKQMLANPTGPEWAMWRLLKKAGISHLFRRQWKIYPSGYIADFYCHDARLVLEVDGPYHEEPIQREKDRARDTVMLKAGLTVVRVTSEELFKSPDVALSRIQKALPPHLLPPQPVPRH